jgi:hypothetical protein
MTFFQFVQAHYLAIGLSVWFLFTSAVNALPPTGTPFAFGAWFMGTLREIAQQAPAKFPALTPAQLKALSEAEVPHA